MANGKSYSENLTFVRSTGVYGTEMREAIATLIEQAGSLVDSKVSSTINTITAEVQDISDRVDSRNLYMTTTKIGQTSQEEDYLLTITNPT